MWPGLRFIALGIAWWVFVEVIRSRSRSHSKALWWLHVTAPLVAAACVGVGIWLLVDG